MPLSPPAPRASLHQRKILTQGFQREDGLWDLEAYLIDTKSYGFDNQDRGWISPGEALHEMSLRLTIDDHLTVCDIEAVTDHSPFHICPQITPNFKRIIGAQIGKGWRGIIKRHLGKTQGCTHLIEMLGILGAVAFQTIYPQRLREQGEAARQDFYTQDNKPVLLNSCYAFSENSPITKRYWPDFWIPADGDLAASGDPVDPASRRPKA